MSTERRRRSHDRGNARGGAPIPQLSARNVRNPYPPMELLSADQLEAIHEASLHILENFGIELMSPRALALFEKAGATVDHATSNVRVEGREDEPLNAYWENVPRQAKRGEKFEVAVNVATGSSCVGKINFPEGLRWTLGNRNEDDAYCRWEVEVPVHSKIGTGQVEVKIERNGKTDTLHSQIQIVDQEITNSNARTR